MAEYVTRLPNKSIITTEPINDWIGVKAFGSIGPYKFDATLTTNNGLQGSSSLGMEALVGTSRVKAGGEFVAGDIVATYEGPIDSSQRKFLTKTKAGFAVNPTEEKFGGDFRFVYFQAEPMEGEIGAKVGFDDYFSVGAAIVLGRENAAINSPELEERLVKGEDGSYYEFRPLRKVGEIGQYFEITVYVPTGVPGQFEKKIYVTQLSKRAQAENGVLVHHDDTYVRQCFPANTAITTKQFSKLYISELSIGETVLAFDPCADSGRGELTPKKVVRTFTNITEEWLHLTWVENGEEKELVTTPGHQFLAAHGSFKKIESLVAGGKGTVVLADGSEAEVTSERIVYSALDCSRRC